MFTGLYKTAMERFENVVINTSVTVFIVLLVLKLTGLAELTYLDVAMPFIVPAVLLVTFVTLARLFDYLADVLSLLSIKMKRLIRRNG